MNGISIDENVNQEISDNAGSTTVIVDTATTTPTNFPSVAGNAISGFGIDNYGTNDIYISWDAGTSFKKIEKKTYLSWDLKGEPTQLQLKTLTSTSDFELMLNLEES